MFDAFPFETWADARAEFWTFGGAGSVGTYVFTALGVIAVLLAISGFAVLENRKLARHAEQLRASGAFDLRTTTGHQA
jgi:hypothetical protein